MALEGIPLGCTFVFLEPSPDAPAGVAGDVVRARYDDPAALARLADSADVVTYEFENVPAASPAYLRSRLPVLPSPAALEASQDRLTEKRLFREVGIPTVTFRPADTPKEAVAALDATGLPSVIKTRRFGYDGKGQAIAQSAKDAARIAAKLGPGLIVEGFADFKRELSVIAVGGQDGSRVFYPVTENHHRRGILRASFAPAPNLAPELQAQAEAFAARVLDRLEYVGVLAIELFETDDALLANEMAPRVHNSGHWTLNHGGPSQFENHVRAVAGLPLADPARSCAPSNGAAAMVNLVGELPDLQALAAVPGARVHLYGKAPRPDRKLGHVNVAGPDADAIAETVRQVWSLLPDGGPLPGTRRLR